MCESNQESNQGRVFENYIKVANPNTAKGHNVIENLWYVLNTKICLQLGGN